MSLHSVPADTCKAGFTKETVPKMEVDSLILVTNDQVKNCTSEHFQLFNSEQVEKISLDVELKRGVLLEFNKHAASLSTEVNGPNKKMIDLEMTIQNAVDAAMARAEEQPVNGG